MSDTQELQELQHCLRYWKRIGSQYPVLAKRIRHEYERVNGFVPYEQGYVYAIQAIGSRYFKLGKSIKPDQRLLQIAPKMPFEIRFVQVWRSNFMSLAEEWLHDHFAKYRANGEWFELDEYEAYCLFYALRNEFEDQICFTYGSVFLERVTESKDQLFLIERSFEEALMSGLWTGSADTIRWIERLFQQISTEDLPLDEGVLQNCLETERGEARRRALADENVHVLCASEGLANG